MSLDTLSIARELRAADLAPSQAEAIASAIGRAVSEGAASKSDIELLIAKIDGLDAKLTARIDGVEGKLSAQTDAAEQRLTAKIEGMRSSLLIWLIGVVIAVTGLLIAIDKAWLR